MAISKLEDSLSADLLNAASCIYNGNSNSHPIILINSLKNILGDVRSNPSNIILDFIRNHTNKLEDNRNDKIYLDAYELAFADGILTEKERAMLSFQANTLNLNEDRVKFLESNFKPEIKSEN